MVPPGTDGLDLSQRVSPQAGMRAQNERMVLTLIRRHGEIAKAEIARLSGLSAQTVSVIMRQLERDALVVRGEPQRGRVGQPSVPHSLNPDGAFFLGAKIGRRSLDIVLTDFAGKVRHRTTERYAFPRPEDAVASILRAARSFAMALGPLGEKIAGLGIAMPFELWAWAEETGAPAAAVEAWRGADVRSSLAEALPFPVYLQNDATAACGAELVFGNGASLSDFLYLFVGSFVGGGIVLNGRLHPGRTGNAGALGSMPVPGPSGETEQLLDQASIIVLERRVVAAGHPADVLYADDGDWAALGTAPDDWLATAGRGLAHAIAATASVLDIEAAVIDGIFPRDIQARLIERVGDELGRLDTKGIALPELRAGALGPVARALGGATLPLFDRYLIAQ